MKVFGFTIFKKKTVSSGIGDGSGAEDMANRLTDFGAGMAPDLGGEGNGSGVSMTDYKLPGKAPTTGDLGLPVLQQVVNNPGNDNSSVTECIRTIVMVRFHFRPRQSGPSRPKF